MTGPPSPASVPRVTGRRQLIAGIITCAVLAIVFLRIMPRVADYGQAWALIRQMPVSGVIILVGLVLVHVLVFAWPLQAVLPRLPFVWAFVARQTAFLISNTVPTGGALAIAVQYGVLADAGVAAAPATAAITLTGLWNLVITLGLPALGAAAMLVSGGLTAQWLVAAGVGIAGVVALIVAILAVLRDEGAARRVGKRADRVTGLVRGRLGRAHTARFGDRLVAVRASTVDVLTSKWLPLTLSSASLPLLQFAILLLALRALQGAASDPVSGMEIFAAFAFVKLATFVPLTPNGLGTVDAGLAGLLVVVGVAGDAALAAVLVWRVATTFPQLATGTATFVYWRRRRAASRL